MTIYKYKFLLLNCTLKAQKYYLKIFLESIYKYKILWSYLLRVLKLRRIVLSSLAPVAVEYEGGGVYLGGGSGGAGADAVLRGTARPKPGSCDWPIRGRYRFWMRCKNTNKTINNQDFEFIYIH